jgi:FKBP-type peptidyl-prolyl cis-trans isomerase
MKIKILYLSFVFVSLLAATGVLYYTKFMPKDSVSDNSEITTSKSKSTNNQNTTNNQPVVAQQPQGQLQVQGDTNQQQQQENRFPLPSEFGVYNQYESAESPLYIDTLVGSGQEAQQGDKVAMLYKGYLTTGELFDQSRVNEENKLEPFIFTIGSGQVITGWEYTIAGMKVGGQRRLIIPSQYGYGPTGQGPIPANATLVFDVELVAIDNQQIQQP